MNYSLGKAVIRHDARLTICLSVSPRVGGGGFTRDIEVNGSVWKKGEKDKHGRHVPLEIQSWVAGAKHWTVC